MIYKVQTYIKISIFAANTDTQFATELKKLEENLLKDDVTLGIVTLDDGDIYNTHIKLYDYEDGFMYIYGEGSTYDYDLETNVDSSLIEFVNKRGITTLASLDINK